MGRSNAACKGAQSQSHFLKEMKASAGGETPALASSLASIPLISSPVWTMPNKLFLLAFPGEFVSVEETRLAVDDRIGSCGPDVPPPALIVGVRRNTRRGAQWPARQKHRPPDGEIAGGEAP